MTITIKKETLEKINEKKSEIISNLTSRRELRLNVQNSLGGVTIFKDNWAICDLEELSQMIEELTVVREAIAEVTGIAF